MCLRAGISIFYKCKWKGCFVAVKTERPIFLKPLQDKEINEEEDCHFETEIYGKPEPKVHW